MNQLALVLGLLSLIVSGYVISSYPEPTDSQEMSTFEIERLQKRIDSLETSYRELKAKQAALPASVEASEIVNSGQFTKADGSIEPAIRQQIAAVVREELASEQPQPTEPPTLAVTPEMSEQLANDVQKKFHEQMARRFRDRIAVELLADIELTETQKEQVDGLIDAYFETRRNLFWSQGDEAKLTQEERDEKLEASKNDLLLQAESVLNPIQMETLKKNIESASESRRGGGRGGR